LFRSVMLSEAKNLQFAGSPVTLDVGDE